LAAQLAAAEEEARMAEEERLKAEEEARRVAEERARRKAEKQRRKADEAARAREEAERKAEEERRADEAKKAKATTKAKPTPATTTTPTTPAKNVGKKRSREADSSDNETVGDLQKARAHAKSVADAQAATVRRNAAHIVLEKDRRCDACQRAEIPQCVVVQGGKKKACERCSGRKKPCEWTGGAAAPETKRRKVGGPKGEGTSAAANDDDEDDELSAEGWLRRLDGGQDDTNRLLRGLLKGMNALLLAVGDVTREMKGARAETTRIAALVGAQTTMVAHLTELVERQVRESEVVDESEKKGAEAEAAAEAEAEAEATQTMRDEEEMGRVQEEMQDPASPPLSS
jgi:hypothetical protein